MKFDSVFNYSFKFQKQNMSILKKMNKFKFENLKIEC